MNRINIQCKLTATMSLAVVMILLCIGSPAQADLLINEFMASNNSATEDPSGGFDDWIELFNSGSEAVDIGGLYLTDDLNNLTKFRVFSDDSAQTTIQPQAYLLFWADSDTAAGPLHLNFGLSNSGEAIALVAADGTTILDSVTFGSQSTDISYGRYPNGGAEWRFYEPSSPLALNSGGYIGEVADTRFSHDRGFYTSAFSLTITCSTPGATIRYTLDGSAPTASSAVYSAPLSISTTKVVRAQAFLTNWKSSNADTQTYVFISHVLNQPYRPAGFPSNWTTYNGSDNISADYEMDPDIINNYRTYVETTLRQLPTMAISTHNDNLFSQATGIYSNPEMEGVNWERPCAVEWINTDGTTGFQVDAGLRIQGGWFRQPDKNKKHSFRLLFKSDYGPSKLRFPVFGDDRTAVQEFDTLTLRAQANDGYSWADHPEVVFIRDQFGRDGLLQMGLPGAHGTWVHLYVNGLYWGVFNPVERPAASFAASYYGGDKENWDALNSGEAIDGSLAAWNEMMGICRAGLADNANYLRLQGKNPDGTRNPGYPVYLDVEQYIDYMINNLWLGNNDWPFKNWYAARDRSEASTGYKFFMWDSEWSMLMNSSVTQNKTTDHRGVAEAYGYLKENAEFRLLFADHLHRHCFNDGVLTTPKVTERFTALANMIEPQVYAESARWGDMQRSVPYGIAEWTAAKNAILDTYLPFRNANVMGQFRNISLYPNVDAPVFQVNGAYKHGGQVVPGDSLTMTKNSGTIYYTLDGSDPRTPSLAGPSNSVTLVPEGAAKRALVPSEEISDTWKTDVAFDDSAWKTAAESTTGSLVLDGDDDFGNAGTTPGSADALTVAFWMKADALGYQVPIDKLPLTGTAGWNIKLRENGGLWFRVGSEGNSNTVQVAGAYVANTWAHFAISFVSGSVRIYKNGALVGSQDGLTRTVNNTVTPLYFGRPSESWVTEVFGGELDDVHIYSRALDAAEVTVLSNRGASPTSGLVGQWKMDELNGARAADSSGNGYHAALSGGPTWTNPGMMGVGYDYPGYVSVDVSMRNINTSCYVRIPFNVDIDDLDGMAWMKLNMRYEDGFVAYINGVKVAEKNAPATLAWNSVTSPAGVQNSDTAAVVWEAFDVTDHIGTIVNGANILAIHGLNVLLTSSDFLCWPNLVAGVTEDGGEGLPLSPSAVEYTGALTLDQSVHVKSRVLNGADWSALNEASFLINAQPTIANLAITEINYNPYNATAEEVMATYTDPDEFEFIELRNMGNLPIDMDGVRFTEGIQYTTSGTQVLDAGAFMLLVRNRAAFEMRYGTGLPVVGEYEGSLSNGGEQLLIEDRMFSPILTFTYNDANAWPGRADGSGSSLQLKEPGATSAQGYSEGDSWRSSIEYGGSPGAEGRKPFHDVIVSEVLTHTDLPQKDFVELRNMTTATISLGGWYLSDSTANYFKFQIPQGTDLDPGDYIVFDEDDFNPTPLTPGPLHFALSGAHGDDIYLLSTDGADGFLFADHVEFGAAPNGESFGRWPTDSDAPDEPGELYPMLTVTRGTANSGPRVGPIIFSEVHYHPAALINGEDLEFVEIYNPTSSTVSLEGWRIRKGIDFDFPVGTSLEPGGVLVVVPFDPTNPLSAGKLTAFREAYGIGESVTLLGGYAGNLDNSGEQIQLQRPDSPPLEEPDYIPYLIEDEVRFRDVAPWPASADGLGDALERQGAELFGNNGASWVGALPSPGGVYLVPEKPAFLSAGVTEAWTDKPYRYVISVKGSPRPAIVVDGLPAWLSFNNIDTLFGTPFRLQAGTVGPITITATNTEGEAQQIFHIQIDLSPLPGGVWLVK